MESAKNIIDFYLESLAEKITDTRELKKKVESAILPYVAIVQSEMEKAHWVGKIAAMLGMKEEPIWDELKKAKISEGLTLETGIKVKPSGEPKTRLEFLKDRLRGLTLWKEVNNDKELSDEDKKLVFEAELFYSGVENLEEEIKNLSRDTERESIKFELEEIARNIRRLELLGKEEDELKKNMDQFHELTKKLNNLK